ncbi:hypothetical protein HKD24_02890 [Gluconobacter sp. LMG 31484]|uniref:Transmembrane protein n=1 Tax=Gluconobacter vitians TaxID=2728102 RepID=A0ABR9Y2S1_9PROT|nr:hypothetical protein [Gluconobacter vitians]MBF0858158.1 hypothetical protein [Gluconobacter vitians]
MADENFELWLAKEKARHSEASDKEARASLDRTKGRATTLIGFMVTLASASVAGALSQKGFRKEASVLGACGFIGAAILCARVLYSTRLHPLMLSPTQFDAVMHDDDERSQEGYLKAFSEYAEDVIVHNETVISRVQKYLRAAWIVACATPFSVLLFWALWRAGR